jgi:hypothetical protein
MVSKPKNPFHWSFLQVLRLVTLVCFDLIEWKLCIVSMNVIMGRRTTIGSINHGCLAHFSIKSFYAQPNVMEIDFYH